MSFRKDFFWDAASSAYQVEGAAFEDGKGPSVWDMFCRKEKTIWNNQNGDIACDHYHRCKQDVALMKKIGLQAYRFSFSWPRVLPEGAGAVNPKGLAFYDRLVDELLKAGITPIFITKNGLSGIDWVALDGRVHDPARIDFMARYLQSLERAMREGVDVRGYFAWSTMDNFEWAEGFKERFGLIYVDFPTQRRILKDSAYWYRDVIATQGRALKKWSTPAAKNCRLLNISDAHARSD